VEEEGHLLPLDQHHHHRHHLRLPRHHHLHLRRRPRRSPFRLRLKNVSLSWSQVVSVGMQQVKVVNAEELIA
jgi:hypothetical protein